ILKQIFHILFFLNNSTVGSCEEQLRNDTLLDELRNEHYDIALAQYLTLCPLAIGRIIGIEKFLWVSPGIVERYSRSIKNILVLVVPITNFSVSKLVLV